MFKSFLFIFVFIGSTTIALCQTQLTNIDNQVDALEYPKNGIVNVNGDDYLIESDAFTLRVSSVTDSIRKIYEVSDYPFGTSIHQIYGRLNTRSGYYVDGEFLYELFHELIRKRNILTGEVVEEYSFPNDQIYALRDMYIIDDIMHFEQSGFFDLAFYNISSKEFVSLPFEKESTFRSGHMYYSKLEDQGIIAYNSTDKTSETLFEDESMRHFGKNSLINGQKGIIFGGFQQTRFLNKDTTFILNCNFVNPVVEDINIHETNDYYIAIFNDLNKTTIKVVDKSDCSIFASVPLDLTTNGQTVNIFTPEIFADEYLLVQVDDQTDKPALFALIDRKDLSIDIIAPEKIEYIFENRFYRMGDTVYFIGRDEINYYPTWKLYELNLNTKSINSVQSQFNEGRPISFSSSLKDSTLLLTQKEDEPISIFKYISSNNTSKINTPNYTRNAGTIPIRYLAIEEEKLIFNTNNGIYLVDQKSDLNDKVSLIAEADQVSELIISNGLLEGLINDDGVTFHMKYQTETDLLTTEPLEDYTEIGDESIAFSEYIFSPSFLSHKIYFDLSVGSFTQIPIFGEIRSMQRSNKNMLFISKFLSDYNMTIFKDGSFLEIELDLKSVPKILPKGNGEFIILENIDEDNIELTIIKEDGSIGSKISVEGKLIENSQTNIHEGPLSALMFADNKTGNLEIIMHRYNDFHSYIIPYIYAGIVPISWYKTGNSIVVESEDDYDDGIYIATLGKPIKKLDLDIVFSYPPDVNFAISNDNIVTIFVDSYPEGQIYIHYNVETESLEYTNGVNNDINYAYQYLNKTYKISESTYLVTFAQPPSYNVLEYGEPYTFDINELNLQELSDINQINQFSNPHRFIESPSYLYFIARSPQNNSYQLFSIQKDQITSVKESDDHKTKINVFPNPSSEFISLGVKAETIHFIDSKGQVIKSEFNHDKDERIDISELEQGIYYLEITNRHQKFVSSFIKI